MSKCENCSRCCTELKLEIMEIDLIREPMLRHYAIKLDNYIGDPDNPLDQAYILPNPCPFLINDKCAIYKSRPNLCVAYGDDCLNEKTDIEMTCKLASGGVTGAAVAAGFDVVLVDNV